MESIVGLQALAKPLQRKLATSSVTKHSMIRALNKLYKRQIPIPTKDVVDDPLAEQEAESLIDLIEPNALNDVPHVTSERLDFSQGPIDSLPFDKR